ncbi:unnamed protein product [Caenorhabditis angaria]|uniref:G-protein coupled receptors family 1 profile domain-containing protein n=1 Tax=Caenorhabditis angaria TaxID=860376 RepID=A0A9P1J489_9PELO|nr:unnamed protein product [Caenorhabditis angaria]
MDNESNCTDIRSYLWKSKNDLTLHPIAICIFLILYTFIITLGVVGNSLVVISVFKHKSLQSVRNMFIVSLSLSDILASIFSGSVTPITAFSKIWLFGTNLCYFVPLVQGFSLCFSTLTMTAISIDRFILIVFPTKKPIQKNHALRMIFFSVSVALAISIPLSMKQKLVGYGSFCGQFCTEDWGNSDLRSAYGTVVMIIQFVIPLIIIAFCYIAISLKLRQGILVRGSQKELMSDQRKAALQRRIRTNRMLIAMVGVFFCCWLPSVVFNFLRDYSWLPNFVLAQEYLFGLITHLISMSSTIWNPCLYTLCNEQFRAAFTMIIQSVKNLGRKEKFQNNQSCSQLLSSGFKDQSTRRSFVAVPSSI